MYVLVHAEKGWRKNETKKNKEETAAQTREMDGQRGK